MKRILAMLLTFVLIIGLLPMVALAEEDVPEKATLRILSWLEISAEEGGAIGYLKNQEYDAFTPVIEDGEIVSVTTGEKGWTQVPGSADDWNIKYEWPKGGTPVLTLKDAKLDMMSDTGVPFCNQITDPDTNETYYTSKGYISAIFTDKGLVNRIDLKIVVQGDNYIDVSNGIVHGAVTQTQYLKNITIVGEDGAKLYASGRGIGISAKSGYSVTLENLTLEMPNTTVAGGIAIPIRTKKADLIIKNCTVTTGNEESAAIYADESGNILIENSTLNVYSKLSSTSGFAAVMADSGTVTINNSKVNAEGANNACINGTSVTVNNSDLNLKSGHYSIYAGGKDGSLGDITINGGSVLSVITADNGGAFWKCPILSANMEGLAGPSEEEADFYDENKYKSMWLKLYNTSVAYNRSATVTASGGANIWSKPYTSGDSIRVRTAAYESKLTVVGKVTNSAGGLWYKLSDGNWVYNTNVRITDYNPADVVSCKKAFTVISWGANIWSKPYSSGDSKVVKVVDKNATLSIVAYVRNSTGGLWYQLSDGGWVYSHNVQEKSYNPADVIAYNRSATVMSSGGANIWSEPSTSGTSKRVRTEKYEAKLTVVGKVTNSAGGLWYKLSDGNWVYSTNVRITDYNPDDVETYNKTFIVTSWGANIWSKPYSSGDSKVIKTVAKDANLSIVAKVRNSTYGLWYQLSDGGWVYSANVKEKTGVSYNAADVVDHKATYVVTGWSVNVWTKPYSSGDSKVAKTVSKGATLSVVAKVTNSSGGLWYKLSDGNWIYSSNVTKK